MCLFETNHSPAENRPAMGILHGVCMVVNPVYCPLKCCSPLSRASQEEMSRKANSRQKVKPAEKNVNKYLIDAADGASSLPLTHGAEQHGKLVTGIFDQLLEE
ncbi:MAG: hypothetical protein LUE08_04275 [Akkermansiaceae bacterium]|nr:hypothetical protein [Akkermansiaceae bacterium]